MRSTFVDDGALDECYKFGTRGKKQALFVAFTPKIIVV
jgi:hypothetical protein